MKQFVLKVLLFVITIIVLLRIFDIFLPYHYGNRIYSEKIKLFRLNKKDYNTVFFGSSRIHNQINPAIFDKKNKGIKSFNFGVQATFNPESYYLLEKFLKSTDSDHIEYIFLEILKLSDINPSNSLTIRGYYWSNFNYLFYINKYIYQSNLSTLKKIKLAGKYLRSYAFKQIDINRFQYWKQQISIENFEGHVNGFSPLKNVTLKSYRIFHSDTSKNYIKPSHELTKELIFKTNQNYGHINKLNSLRALAKEKNIELFYILTPRSSNFSFALQVLKSLPKNRVLNLANQKEYPDLYLTKYSFDIAHLNEDGSNIFTSIICKEFNNKLSTKILSK